MRHYDIKQWKLFSENLIEENMHIEMQQHLLECDQCMELYLTSVEEKTSGEDTYINETFTDNVINTIRSENKKLKDKYYKRRRINLIGCYAAASCLTIILMWSGAFQFLFDAVPKYSAEFANSSLRGEKKFVSGWTDRLTDETSNLIKNISTEEASVKNKKSK